VQALRGLAAAAALRESEATKALAHDTNAVGQTLFDGEACALLFERVRLFGTSCVVGGCGYERGLRTVRQEEAHSEERGNQQKRSRLPTFEVLAKPPRR
jgi:hypothetical protein